MYLLTGGKPEGITIVINHVYKGKINEKTLYNNNLPDKTVEGRNRKGTILSRSTFILPIAVSLG